MATQGERRADTRRRLLLAAAELFAERGVDGTSIDAIAERADRTSGAVYDHFGGKDGVLVALVDTWVGELGAVIGAELTTATTLDERLAVLWRNVSAPVVGGDRWITLELELWTHASRDPAAREHLVRRYRGAWDGIVRLAGESDDAALPSGPSGPSEREGVGPAVIGLLLGLEMMRRVDPDTVSDELAVAALRGVVAATTQAPPKTRGVRKTPVARKTPAARTTPAAPTTGAGDHLTGAPA